MAQAAVLAAGLVTTYVLSRHLGVEGFGRFTYIFAFFYLFLLVNDFGVTTTVVREVSQDRERAGEIIGAMLSFRVLLSLISMVAAWLVARLTDFPEDLRRSLYLFALILPLNALQLPSVIFQATMRVTYPVAVGIASRCLGVALTLWAVWAGYGLRAVVTALVVTECFTTVLLFWGSRKFVRLTWGIRPGLWRRVLRSSAALGAAGLFAGFINRADFLMLERMSDLSQVGLYGVAYKVTNLLETFPLILMSTLYPLMSRYAVEDTDKLRRLFRKGTLYLGLVALVLGVAVTLGAPLIVHYLFGPQFAEAARPLAILVWATAFMYLALIGGMVTLSLKRERTNLTILCVGAVLNFSLNLVWIPRWGCVGAALSTTVTFFFILVATIATTHVYLKAKDSGLRVDFAGPSLKTVDS